MKLLHELIADYAAAFPGKAAAEDERGTLTYGSLEKRSVGIAAALSALGFRAGDAAAVYVPYAREILLGAVSILRAGGVFVPFDDAYPPDRLNDILNDCEAKAVLTLRELWEKRKLDFPEERVIFMEEQAEQEVKSELREHLDQSSPAMLLYTSGTTGKPKGVPHSHGFLLHLTDWMNAHPGAEMNADTRSGVISAFPFVGTEMFLLGPLAKGGTVCFAPEEARKDLGFLYQFLVEARVSHIFLSSSLAAILAEDRDIGGIWIFAAGEKLRPFRALRPGNCLINSYGSTETGGVLSQRIYGHEQCIAAGKPGPGTKALIVDEDMRPTPAGEAGELLIANDHMARSYFRLPELSAEKWVNREGIIWFRTGDRARLTAEGDYEILGRMDNMIKLRGFRIEAGEVETQIANAAGAAGGVHIGQNVVVGKTLGGTEHLCCYYEAEREMDVRAVSGKISKLLAPYMVPEIWVRMDALPRNANGKVLRGELPAPARRNEHFGTLDSEVIARLVWTAAEVLKIGTLISPDDSFTALGGTSLTAMVFTARLREQGIRITSQQALRLGSLREIAGAADVIWEQLWTPEEYESVRADFARRGEKVEKVLPIAPWQDEMLFDQLLHPDWACFKNVILLQVDSAVSQAHLREALDALAGEYEELRAAIVYHGVTVVQQAITDRKIPLEMIEADAFGGREMTRLHNSIIYRPMDLQFSSLMRVIAVRAGKETFLYVLTHRIAFGLAARRKYLARLAGLLESRYPDDASLRGWRRIFEEAVSSPGQKEKPTANAEKKPAAISKEQPELWVYSENKGPRLVFVHTGNTGSEAYYTLADRIRDRVSFAVIEPFNLYHPQEALSGIDRVAAKYIEILKRCQPEGPYLLGGWCYGGVVAHEMACQLERAGEKVAHLFLLDAHAMGDERLVKLSESMHAEINREYFETCPLFAELRAAGMLDAMVVNADRVSQDLMRHIPSVYHGCTTYFKPQRIPANVSDSSRKYWEAMMDYSAGNYERYCDAQKLTIVPTPHEHDLMMDGPSLDIIVPRLLADISAAQDAAHLGGPN